MSPEDDPTHLPGDEREHAPGARRMEGPGTSRPDPPSWLRWALVLGGIAAITLFALGSFGAGQAQELTYSELVEAVRDGRVAEVTIDADGRVDGRFVAEEGQDSRGERFRSVVPTALEDQELLDLLQTNEVAVVAEPPSEQGWLSVLVTMAPFLLIIGLFWYLSRRAGGRMKQLTGIGRSQADIITTDRPETTFDDIAGYHGLKEEVREVVDYLTDPSKYERAGARGPGGILLIGPPGTGKTLMARAVAGESGVPFLSVEGSSFVQMLVGVGASRVRDLFEKARENAPAIVFIDELDSVGRKRGGAATIGANNEQEQTLNQLLAEMDGFEPAEGVVVIAATNRPQLLDEALLRPGRFDRQLRVAVPRLPDRAEILEIHCRDKQLADDVDLHAVARGTPGFSGAELENLCNEAAITAVRDDRQVVHAADFDAARTRIMLGRREDSDILRPEEQRRVAIHESGHAIVAAVSEHADPVSKVTILPTGRALGTTEQLPVDERRLHMESDLVDVLAVRVGGRAAELAVLGEASTGSANDLKTATGIATRMVRDFGLSDRLGPVGYADDAGLSMGDGGERNPLQQRPYAEDTQRAIDQEVARLMREAEKRALDDVEQHRDALERLVDRLLEEETVDGEVVYELVDRPVPGRDDA